LDVASGSGEYALGYLDLDRFKIVNDIGGHESGDAMLHEVGSLLGSLLRGRDTVGRLGGDEFGVLLEQCTLPKAEEIARKIQRAISDLRFVREGRSFSVGVSIGIVPITAASGGVGLDDFGNGLTSFAHLKALSVDFVKIGGHYVRGVVEDPVYGTLVSTVNEIGRIMGITTIAEEVESEHVLEKLRSLGVGYAQGLAVGSPAPLADDEGAVSIPCVRRSA
jgi:predicted signal transduction protein with EAL and GGDEF domain